jgi:hypothetical protein
MHQNDRTHEENHREEDPGEESVRLDDLMENQSSYSRLSDYPWERDDNDLH